MGVAIARRPYWKVTANTVDITSILANGLIRLVVTDNAGKEADTCEIEFFDTLGKVALPPPGAELDVQMGYNFKGTPMGKFIVDKRELSGPPRVISLRGTSVPFTVSTGTTGGLAMTGKKSRSFDNLTLGAIAQTLAGESKLTAQVDPELRTKLIDHADQTESDLHFINRLAEKYGGYATVKDGKLLVAKWNKPASPATGVPLVPIPLLITEVSKWRLELSSRQAFLAARAYYFDKTLGQRMPVIVTAPGVTDLPPNGAIDDVPFDLSNADEAANVAASSIRQSAVGGKSLELTLANGSPFFSAETPVLLSQAGGWDSEVAGTWNVKIARHIISKDGYRTTLELVPPG